MSFTTNCSTNTKLNTIKTVLPIIYHNRSYIA